MVIIYFLLFIIIYLFSANIKPPRHRFGFSLAWGWQLVNPNLPNLLPLSLIPGSVNTQHLLIEFKIILV